MKIALYVHCFFPRHYHGTETYTLALAKNLLAMGHIPVVISSIPEGEDKAHSLITHYEYQGIPVYCIDKNHLPHTSLMETYYQPEMRQVHKNMLLELRPDIIHVTHLFNHTATLLEVAQELAIPIMATFTDFFGFCMTLKLEAADGSLCDGPNLQRTNCFACNAKAGVRRVNSRLSEKTLNNIVPLIRWGCALFDLVHDLPILRYSKLSKRLRDIKVRPGFMAERYAFYSAVIAPTRFLQAKYERNGIAAVPIKTINFGVDLDRKSKEVRPSSAPIRFGFVGQIAPHKGTDLLVEAFCRLPKGESELYIYGAESQYPAYTQGMRKRSNNFPVFFKGTFSSEQMRSVLDELDFLVIPSIWYENSPLVLLNALASHTPVIVSDVEGLTEFLEPSKNGYAFARGNINDLERVMREIIVAPEKSRKLSLTTNYSKTSKDMTEEVVEIYNSINTKEPA